EAGGAHPSFGIDVPAELGRDHDLVANGRQRLRYQDLICPRAIGLRRVEESHAALIRAANDADCFGMVRRFAVGGGKAHCAKADFGDRKGSQHTGFHVALLWIVRVCLVTRSEPIGLKKLRPQSEGQPGVGSLPARMAAMTPPSISKSLPVTKPASGPSR